MNYPVSMYGEVATLYEQYEQTFSDRAPDERDDIKSEITTKMTRAGYDERLSGGTYRAVHLNDDHVVKFAIGKLGRKENGAEITNRNRIADAGNDVRDVVDNGTCSGVKYIADIDKHEIGPCRWLVMDRATVTPNNVSPDTADAIQTALADAGIHIAEIKPYNMGRIDDVPVVFDYAGK